MNDSILTSIKKLLNIAEDDTSFDVDIIIGINSALSKLLQIGIGPQAGLTVTGSSETWAMLVASDFPWFSQVKTYVFIETKLLFDPPSNSYTIEMFERHANELYWRLSVAKENKQMKAEV